MQQRKSLLSSNLNPHHHSDWHSIIHKAEEGLCCQTSQPCIFSSLFCCGEISGVKGANVYQAALNFGLDFVILLSQLLLFLLRLAALSRGETILPSHPFPKQGCVLCS